MSGMERTGSSGETTETSGETTSVEQLIAETRAERDADRADPKNWEWVDPANAPGAEIGDPEPWTAEELAAIKAAEEADTGRESGEPGNQPQGRDYHPLATAQAETQPPTHAEASPASRTEQTPSIGGDDPARAAAQARMDYYAGIGRQPTDTGDDGGVVIRYSDDHDPREALALLFDNTSSRFTDTRPTDVGDAEPFAEPAVGDDTDAMRTRELRAVDASDAGGAPPVDAAGTAESGESDEGVRWAEVEHLLPTDRSGYQVTPRDCDNLGISPAEVRDWANRDAPLGMRPEQYTEFTDSLYQALSEAGIDPDHVDIRLQGSSARFFSGDHKQLPTDTDLTDDPVASGRIDAIWPDPEHRPIARPFDAMHHLGRDIDPSDYDIQISSDAMVQAARPVWIELRDEDPDYDKPFIKEPYGFINKDAVREAFPRLLDWVKRWEDDLGREVAPALFGSTGPPDNSPGISAHFQDEDWVIGSPATVTYGSEGGKR